MNFRNRLHRKRWIHFHDHRRRLIWLIGVMSLRKLKVRCGIERRADRVLRIDGEQRVTVVRRVDDKFRADIAAGSGFHVNDERLAEMVLQPLANQPGVNVGRACGRLRHDDMHWMRGNGVGLRQPGDGRQAQRSQRVSAFHGDGIAS